jgi:hypothetical protein
MHKLYKLPVMWLPLSSERNLRIGKEPTLNGLVFLHRGDPAADFPTRRLFSLIMIDNARLWGDQSLGHPIHLHDQAYG